MSKINLNLQLFGNGTGDWTQGVTETAVREAYDAFVIEVNKAKEIIEDVSVVGSVLKEGWQGNDLIVFMAKFDMYREKVIEQINAYTTEVGATAEDIIIQWKEFQKNLVE